MEYREFAKMAYDFKTIVGVNPLEYQSIEEFLNALLEKASMDLLEGWAEHLNPSNSFKKQAEEEIQKRLAI